MVKPGRKPEVSDVEILREFMLTAEPFLHPTELVGEFGIESRQGIYNRFVELEDEGFLDSKKTAGTRNWWITDAGRRYVADNS